jgi:Fe-S-cluster containining protein
MTALEQANARLLALLPVERALACRRGCAHCCRQRVSVTALEVFELAAHLQRELDTATLARVREQVRVTASRVRGRSAAEQRGIACPLNQADGSCLAYASRPLPCRGANSFDASACAEPGAAIPTYLELAEAAALAQEPLDAESLRISGREEMLELACALEIVLEQPDVEARWRRGEPVFRAAAHAWIVDGVLHEWATPRGAA